MKMVKSLLSDENEVVQIAKESARGGYYLFVGNTLSTGILTVSSIIIARLLGPDDYGLFSLSIAVPSLFIGLVDFGITSAITRFSAKFRAEDRTSEAVNIIKAGILFELAVGIASSIFCFLFSDVLATYLINRPDAGFYIKVASFLVLFQTLFNAFSSVFMGLDNMESNAVVMTVRAIAKILLSPLLIILGFGIFGALLGHVSCYIVAVVISMVILSLKLRKNRDNHKSDLNKLKTMLKYGAPLYVSGLLGLFTAQYQTIIIAFLTSNTEIGNFQVATLFPTAMALLVVPFQALFPAFSKLDPNNGQFGQFFKRSVKYTALLLVPASVAIAVLSKDMVFIFFGQDYNLAPIFVALYILMNLYAGFGSAVLGFLFSGIGRTDVFLKSNLISLLVIVPLAPLLTAFYGIIGLIAVLFISGFCSLLYQLSIAAKEINAIPDAASSAKIYITSGISALFSLAFLSISPFNSILNLILGGIIFCFMYLTLLPVIGVITFTDVEIFKSMFYKIKGVRFVLKFLLSYETKLLGYKQKLGH
jgi:O-antigen/teichoic acid export membrane protein